MSHNFVPQLCQKLPIWPKKIWGKFDLSHCDLLIIPFHATNTERKKIYIFRLDP